MTVDRCDLKSGAEATQSIELMARELAAGVADVEFVAELFVVAAEVAHQGEEVRMGADGAEMRVVLEGPVIGETDFGGVLEFVNGFVGFAAERIDFGGDVICVVKMEHTAF